MSPYTQFADHPWYVHVLTIASIVLYAALILVLLAVTVAAFKKWLQFVTRRATPDTKPQSDPSDNAGTQ